VEVTFVWAEPFLVVPRFYLDILNNDQVVQDLEGIDFADCETGNYSPPHRDAFLLLDQQLTPISSRCRVESNCRRDVSRAASCDATLVVSSGTLLV
jgi:hypothetical protein